MKNFIKENKRKLSVILAIAILAVLVCVYALVNLPKKVAINKADEEELKAQQETEVPDGYTGIYNADDLRNMANNLAGKYILMVDLDMTDEAWTPIGLDASSAFTGTFEGNYYTISNLTINSSNRYVGLFGYINGGTVQNLILENVNIKTTYTGSYTSNMGSIAGYSTGQISNIKVSGNVTGKDSIGGIVGYTGGTGAITDVENNSRVGKKYNNYKCDK